MSAERSWPSEYQRDTRLDQRLENAYDTLNACTQGGYPKYVLDALVHYVQELEEERRKCESRPTRRMRQYSRLPSP